MKRSWVIAWAAGVLVALAATMQAAVPENAKYSGSRMCIACHRATHKDVVTRYVDSPMANALIGIEDAEEEKIDAYLKGDFSTAPFTKEDVAWILASGVHQQAYLDADFNVLPAKWIVATKTWEATPAVDAITNCIPCHSTNVDTDARTFKVAGVGCESCHGPGSVHNTAAADKKMETIVQPRDLDQHVSSAICGACHSRGHAKDDPALPYAKGFMPEQDLNEYFVHDTVTGPGLNQQYTDLINTKHWENGIGCISCHDPHGNTDNIAQLKKGINETCLECHADTVTDIATHAAANQVTPPADATCATCHMPEGRHLFDKSVADAVTGHTANAGEATPVQNQAPPPGVPQ